MQSSVLASTLPKHLVHAMVYWRRSLFSEPRYENAPPMQLFETLFRARLSFRRRTALLLKQKLHDVRPFRRRKEDDCHFRRESWVVEALGIGTKAQLRYGTRSSSPTADSEFDPCSQYNRAWTQKVEDRGEY